MTLSQSDDRRLGSEIQSEGRKQPSIGLADLIRPLDLKGSVEPVAVTHSNDCDRCCAVIPSLRAITLASPARSPQLFFFLYVTCEENSTCAELLPPSQSINCLLQVARFQGLETGPSARGNLSAREPGPSVCFCFDTCADFLDCFSLVFTPREASFCYAATLRQPLKRRQRVCFVSRAEILFA